MIKPVLQVGQEGADVLNQITKEVTDFNSSELKRVMIDLKDTALAGQKYTAGLAAPQIGSNLRVCIINRLDLEKPAIKSINTKENNISEAEASSQSKNWSFLINPKFKPTNDQDSQFWEACLSIGVGEKQLWGPVWRPEKIEVEYQDETGKLQSLKADGFFSHLVQHEIDHLEGILFISRVSKPELNLWKAKELDQYLETNNEYPEVK